jgi:hypothetical protein
MLPGQVMVGLIVSMSDVLEWFAKAQNGNNKMKAGKIRSID